MPRAGTRALCPFRGPKTGLGTPWGREGAGRRGHWNIIPSPRQILLSFQATGALPSAALTSLQLLEVQVGVGVQEELQSPWWGLGAMEIPTPSQPSDPSDPFAHNEND